MRIKESPVRKMRQRAVALMLGIIYYLALLNCYRFLIVPSFSYTGLNFFMLPTWTWGVSIILSLLPLLWMPLNFTRASDFTSWILYLCLIFPANIFTFMISRLPPDESIILPIALNASFIIFEYIRRKNLHFEFPYIKKSTILFDYFLPIITLTLTLVIVAQESFQFNFSIADIYIRRMASRNILSDSSIASYLEAFLASVCVPVGIIYGLEKKNWRYIVVAIFAIVVIFSMKGSKGLFISPLVFLTIYFLVSTDRRKIGLGILSIFTFLVVLSLFEELFADSTIIASYFIRRKLVVPTQLTSFYWDFFSHNPFVMMQDSMLSWLIPGNSNYSIPRARLIGFEYLANVEINANANIWATGYADFGYFGMILSSILAAFTLQIIDKLSTEGGRFAFASVCCAFIGLVWSETAFYTSFLSNGVLFLIIALWVYPSQHSQMPKLK